VANYYSCKQSSKKDCEDTIVPQDFQKAGFDNGEHGVVKLGYPIMLVGKKKC
jgi:hypothetical protein